MDKRGAILLGLSGASFAIGALVLLGWALGAHSLLAVLPGHVTMKPNTAVCFLVSAVALASLRHEMETPPRRRMRTVCAALVVMLAGLTLFEYAAGLPLGIDEALFREPVVSSGSSHPGRMAPNSAFNFCLVGAALLVSRSGSRHAARVAQGLVFLVLFVTLLAMLGYLYRAQVLVGLFSLNRMSLHTILGFASLATGLLVATSARGWVGELLRTRSTRLVASRLLPAALVVPVGIGAAVLSGYRAGLYDAAFAACLMASAEVVSFTLLIWLSVRALNAFESEKTSSRLDELTGLCSRRGFVIEAGEALDAWRRSGKGALTLFVDLDGMKQINDRQGHHVGDAALVEMASVLRSLVRGTDVIARLGGDEFVVFCGGTDDAGGTEIVERLATKLEELNATAGRRYRLACSAGFATTSAADRDSLDDLLVSADAAMYRVKRSRAAA